MAYNLPSRRAAADKLLRTGIWAQGALVVVAALLQGSEIWLPAGLAVILAAGATLARSLDRQAGTEGGWSRMAMGAASAELVGLLIYQAHGQDWQLALYGLYYVCIGCLAALSDWRAIAAGTAMMMLHCLFVGIVMPDALAPAGFSFWWVPGLVAVGAVTAFQLGMLVAQLEREFFANAEAARKAAEVQSIKVTNTTMQILVSNFEAKMQNVVHEVSAAVAALNESASTLLSNEDGRGGDLHDALVARAAEQLAVSVRGITSQISAATATAGKAVEEARGEGGTVEKLAAVATHVGEVFALINNIAAHTNLMAVNTTIQAANAGEAGKGFGVVANEVKMLAYQTAKATVEIQEQIQTLHTETRAAQLREEVGGLVRRMRAA